MPTSETEAQKIVEIMAKYLSCENAKAITEELEREVAQHTDNDSLRISLEMLKALYWQDFKPDLEYRNP
jgi:hypothetical protein